jgi:hypothetical protein
VLNESRRQTASAINRTKNKTSVLTRGQTTHEHASLNLGMRVFSCEVTRYSGEER